MIQASILGLLVGVGCVLTFSSLKSRRVPISELVDVLNYKGHSNSLGNPPSGHAKSNIEFRATQEGTFDLASRYHHWRRIFGNSIGKQMSRHPSICTKIGKDLNITQSDLSDIGTEIATVLVGVGALITVVFILISLLGVQTSFGVPVIVIIMLFPLLAFVPFVDLKKRAELERERYRYAIGIYLELVSLGMAGAMGIESALDTASQLSDEIAFKRIRECLARAKMKGIAPWETLGQLGREIGVSELCELASNVNLAGAEGAKIRNSLRSKSSTIRKRILSSEESRANAVTEKMFVPGVILLAGFMVFVGYPAMIHVFKGV